eukprot:8962056-Alexandrium_andersonii.AAC.1
MEQAKDLAAASAPKPADPPAASAEANDTAATSAKKARKESGKSDNPKAAEDGARLLKMLGQSQS